MPRSARRPHRPLGQALSLVLSLFSTGLAPGSTASAETLLDARFDEGPEGFAYADDAFRDTRAPDYANGDWRPDASRSGGALAVVVGDRDGERIDGMSGAWTRRFRVSSDAAPLRVSIRYRLTQRSGFEADEYAQLIATIDGRPLAHYDTFDYVDQIAGDGDGGDDRSTGWRVFARTLTDVDAGEHLLAVGLYANKKTAQDESAELLIDEVRVEQVDAASPRTAERP